MKTKRLPKSLKIHIRLQKARIRRDTLDAKEAKELVNELYKKYFPEQNPTEPEQKPETKKTRKQENKKATPSKNEEKPSKKGELKKTAKKKAANPSKDEAGE